MNLVGSIVFTKTIGLAGPLLGTTLGFTAVGLWTLPLLLRREFGTPVLPLLKAAGLPVMLGAAVTLALRAMGPSIPATTWLMLLSLEGTICLGLMVMGAVCFVPKVEREEWLARVRGLRKGRA